MFRVKSLSKEEINVQSQKLCSIREETGRGKGKMRMLGKMKRRESMCTRAYDMVSNAGK
jgi:hypothetical protein